MPEAGERPKIIIDAKGTEKEIPPKEESLGAETGEAPKPKEKQKKSKGGIGDFGKGVAAGAIGGEAAETLINEGAKVVRKALWGREGRGRAGSKGDKETQSYWDRQEKEIRESIGKRSFKQIQGDLIALIKKPNPLKEAKLETERQKPLRVAENVGVFDKIKRHFDQVRTTLDFSDAKQAMERTNVNSLESEARGLFGWDAKLEGILSEYKDVALLNMELALIRAQGGENSRQAKILEREIEVRGWGTVPTGLERKAREYLESQKSKGKAPETRETLRGGGGNEYYNALVKFYGEREPSFGLALSEFQRAERLCEFYKIEDHKLISDKIKDEAERRIFEIRVKIFNAALVKRFQGAGTMKGVGENPVLKTISTPELVHLFRSMPGYLETMQEIADIVVNRRQITGVGFSLLDCRSEDQFVRVSNKLDAIVRDILISRKYSRGDAQFLARRAISTALNTMYSFNVFEFYNPNWKGAVRYKYLESQETAPPGKEGPSLYDRLVAKPIMDAFCPMDDFLNTVLKAEAKEPTPSGLVRWAKLQMAKSGVRTIEDFDVVSVLGYSERDIKFYWKLQKQVVKGVESRVLFVPPVRPSRIWGSILDVSKVNLEGEDDPKKMVPFLEALAKRSEINFGNIGIASNACSLYTLDAPDLDVLKSTFRGQKPAGEWPEVMKALGTFGLGKCMELIAWTYAGLFGAIRTDKNRPVLNSDVVYITRYQREGMGLPRRDDFDLIDYLRRLLPAQKIKW